MHEKNWPCPILPELSTRLSKLEFSLLKSFRYLISWTIFKTLSRKPSLMGNDYLGLKDENLGLTKVLTKI